MNRNFFTSLGLAAYTITTLLLLAGCAGVENEAGIKTTYIDPASPGELQGTGIEGQDIISMTDQMARDMLKDPRLSNRENPPHVIVDSAYFSNESSQPLNKNIITNRLRSELNRAAKGRMIFVARHLYDMVAEERELKSSGAAAIGAYHRSAQQLGGDYRLSGTVASRDGLNSKTGMRQTYHQINFEMVDLVNGELIWSGLYEFTKVAQDDVVYR